MKRYFKFINLFTAIMFIFVSYIFSDTCNIPFPNAVTYPYGIKPNNFTQAQMNQHCLDWFNKWRAKYVTQNGCTASEWRLQRLETGNMISKGCSENDTVSEGIGYGMVIMVYMSSGSNNTKQYFDGMYTYYKDHLDGAGLMNWQIPYCDSGGSATDADEDVAFALLAADKQWGSAGTINYKNEATTIIGRILSNEMSTANDVRPGDGWDGGNISYFAPYEYRMFGDYTGVSRWYSVASHTYSTIVNYYYNAASTNNAALGIKTGLQPNWCNYDGTTWSPGTWSMDANSWWWDAIRHVWRQSYDYILYGTKNHQLAQDNNERVSYFFKTKYNGDASQIKSHYTLDGTETFYNRGDRTPDLGTEDVKNLPGPEGAVAIAAMVEGDQDWLNKCYYTLVTMNAGTGSGELTDTGVAWGTDYFCDILKMQYLLILTGNMPNPMGNYPSPSPTNTWDTSKPTPTPVGRGMFDDFETGALKNLDSTAGGQSGFTSVTNATDRVNSGTHSLKIVSTNSSWGAFGIDSPYDGGLGYRDYTGATTLDFYIYSTSAITFFAKIVEANTNGGDGEIYSNRGSQSSASANTWTHISIPITNTTVFHRDQYDTKTGTNNIMNLSAIASFYIQIDAAPNATIWIDDINFTGSFPTYTATPTLTRTKTPFGSPTVSPTITATLTNTPYYSPTISATPSNTQTSTMFISPTITQTPSITPTYTLTPNIPFGIFDDFETTVLKKPSTADTGGGSTLTISNSTTSVHAGSNSMKAVMTGTGWAVASIDSPYDGGMGSRDFTGATGISFWINAPAATGFFIKIVESNGQQWSNRGAAFTTGAAGWQQITLSFTDPKFTVDQYSPAGDGDTVFDLNIIKSVQFQWDNSGSKTVYIDDIFFTGIPTPTTTPSLTRTPSSTRTMSFTPVSTATPSRTASSTYTLTATATYTWTQPAISPTFTLTHTLTYTYTPANTVTFTFTITPTPTGTFTLVNSPTSSVTSTGTITMTISISPTGTPPTATYTQSYTATGTNTASPTSSPTATRTGTNTATLTATPSVTPILTFTATGTATITATNTPYQSPTNSPTGTPPTKTVTATYTNTNTFTFTATSTVTITNSPANTNTMTATNVIFTRTATPTLTATPVITPTAETGKLTITDVAVYPCPYYPDKGDFKLKINLSKSCIRITVRVYTRGFRHILDEETSGSFKDTATVGFAGDDFIKLSSGVYYYVVEGESSQHETAKSKIETFIILK
jgi:hypothetical protein